MEVVVLHDGHSFFFYILTVQTKWRYYLEAVVAVACIIMSGTLSAFLLQAKKTAIMIVFEYWISF